MNWINKLQQTFIEGDRYMWLIEGLVNTLIITLGALVIGVIIGTLIAITKYFCEGNKKLRVLNWLCDLYTTVIRGIPITVLLLMFFYIILVSADGVTVAIIAFGINSGAYVSENIRAGILSVDKGQMEAGRALGLSWLATMTRIILPQAVKIIIPAIGHEMIALLKETSIVGMVGSTVGTLTFDLNAASNTVFRSIPNFLASGIIAGCFYLIVVYLLVFLVKIIERRLRASDNR